MSFSYDLVVPSIGRPSLVALLDSLAADAEGTSASLPGRILLCDDRPPAAGGSPLVADPPAWLASRIVVVPVGGRGPAAARNAGWRRSAATWIAFLDDDVLVPAGWLDALAEDLRALDADVAASQGRIHVPLPTDRAPTDWERNVAGLTTARWATADMAYRRTALAAVGGFDERFPRAYREDADLGLRIIDLGLDIVQGQRQIVHPVRGADRAVSVRMQAGNAEDPFMRALHGPHWRRRAGVPRGRRRWHLATVGAGLLALVAAATGRRREARAAALGWLALTADLARRRIAPGPRGTDEVLTMALTSVVLPPAATLHWLRGIASLPRRLSAPAPLPCPDAVVPRPAAMRGDTPTGAGATPAAVLLDRDGTLVHDVPYNGDPDRVVPVAGAREAMQRLRDLGIPTAVITNQSGIARGWIGRDQVDAVNARLAALIGPLGPVLVCPHDPEEGCGCRKPAPGLLVAAAEALGVAPEDCVVIGDIGADVEAAAAVGARGILVPTPRTRPEEIAAASEVVGDLISGVELALRPAARRTTP